MNVLLLHRKDLRVHDNQALLEACEHKVLAVYHDEETTTDPWLYLCLQELQAEYRSRGCELIITKAIAEITSLVHKHNIEMIYTQ